jgi:hypothetical protein
MAEKIKQDKAFYSMIKSRLEKLGGDKLGNK